MIRSINLEIFIALFIFVACKNPSSQNYKTHLQQAEYYVSPENGNDSNNGKQMKEAFRTLSRANEIVKAGVTVLLLSGIYRYQTIKPKVSGSKHAPIVFRAASGSDVVFSGADLFIELKGFSYIDIIGPIIFKQPINGWGILDNSHHIQITGCTFIGTDSKNRYSGLNITNESSFYRFIDIKNLTFEPSFYQHVKPAFNPVGLMIDVWDKWFASGQALDVPVHIINDTLFQVNDYVSKLIFK